MGTILANASGDGFAVVMVTVLAVAFGMVLGILIHIVRHNKRRDREVEKLLEEVTRNIRGQGQPRRPALPPRNKDQKQPPREPWERDSDWWKSE